MRRNNIPFCRNLRRNQTDAEKELWRAMRSRQLSGVKFRRQFSIGDYIVDFYSPEYRLAIEADGGQHYEDKGQEQDKLRDKELSRLGVQMLRFSNKEILSNLEGVLIVIQSAIKDRKRFSPHPALSPLGRGIGKKQCFGMTMLELVIALAIFMIVSSVVIVLQMTAQDTFSEGNTESDLERYGANAINMISDNLSDCKIVSAPVAANHYTSMTIQVPVELTGSYWTGTAINWGADNTLNYSLKYCFSLRDTKYETTAPKLDWNRDGDVLDAFQVGDILEVTQNSGGTAVMTRTICSYVMLNNALLEGDVNGDGNNDPLFQFLDSNGNPVTTGGNRIRMNLWLGGRTGAKDTPVIVNAKREMALLNPQD